MPYGRSPFHQRAGNTPAERLEFYSTPEPNSGCLLWMGAVNRAGYAHVTVGNRSLSAHRVAFELRHGEIPRGLYVCHKCDVRSCVNPDHLFLGTHVDNMADMVRKQRRRRNPTVLS